MCTQYALILLPGLVAGRLSDLGYFKWTMFISRSATGFCFPQRASFDRELEISVILVMATALTAECKEYWQLLICQGLLTGSACGMLFCPIPAICAQWFKKRRSLASGIITTGASLGGTVIPIVARNLVELIGYVGQSSVQGTRLMDLFRFKWMMRVIALIELFMLAIANLVRVLCQAQPTTA